MGSTWVSYPGLTQVLFTRRRYCCIIRKSSHVANVFKLTCSLLLIVVSPLCISAEKKHLGFWHWIKSSPQTANKADILLSLRTLPRSAILTHFRTSVKSGSTLLLSRVHPIVVVPCKHVNPGSNRVRRAHAVPTSVSCAPCSITQQVTESVVAPLTVDRCTFSPESGVMCRPLTCNWWCITHAGLSHVG